MNVDMDRADIVALDRINDSRIVIEDLIVYAYAVIHATVQVDDGIYRSFDSQFQASELDRVVLAVKQRVIVDTRSLIYLPVEAPSGQFRIGGIQRTDSLFVAGLGDDGQAVDDAAIGYRIRNNRVDLLRDMLRNFLV